jgi:hypothetical protein
MKLLKQICVFALPLFFFGYSTLTEAGLLIQKPFTGVYTDPKGGFSVKIPTTEGDDEMYMTVQSGVHNGNGPSYSYVDFVTPKIGTSFTGTRTLVSIEWFPDMMPRLKKSKERDLHFYKVVTSPKLEAYLRDKVGQLLKDPHVNVQFVSRKTIKVHGKSAYQWTALVHSADRHKRTAIFTYVNFNHHFAFVGSVEESLPGFNKSKKTIFQWHEFNQVLRSLHELKA